jgi:hypothetical protein
MLCATLTGALASIAMSAVWASPALAQAEYDSAGVTIVHNPPAAGRSLDWTVGPEPQIEIGGATDDARYQLFRVVDAVRLSDGRIVVANGGSYELRFYDGSGAYVSAVGREGGGPGEFKSMWGLEVGTDDSIYVFDSELQRLSIFDVHGELVRDFSVLSSIGPLGYVGRFADGRWYVRDWDRLQPGPAGAIRRDTASYFRFDAAFGRHSLITTLPGIMTAIFRGAGSVGIRRAPFSTVPAHDVLGNCLYVVSGGDFDLRVFLSNGELVRLIRNDGELESVSEADRTGWIDDLLVTEAPEEARPQLRRFLEDIPTPEKLPVYNDVIVDAQGYIWLQEYTPLPGRGMYWSGSGRWWIVLDPTAKLLGRVEMPVALDVTEIGRDYVLGRWQDEIGEEFVRVYQLHRQRDPNIRPPLQCTASPVR